MSNYYSPHTFISDLRRVIVSDEEYADYRSEYYSPYSYRKMIVDNLRYAENGYSRRRFDELSSIRADAHKDFRTDMIRYLGNHKLLSNEQNVEIYKLCMKYFSMHDSKDFDAILDVLPGGRTFDAYVATMEQELQVRLDKVEGSFTYEMNRAALGKYADVGSRMSVADFGRKINAFGHTRVLDEGDRLTVGIIFYFEDQSDEVLARITYP